MQELQSHFLCSPQCLGSHRGVAVYGFLTCCCVQMTPDISFPSFDSQSQRYKIPGQKG